jgi:predicted CoA-substrate-specific enzyme activase
VICAGIDAGSRAIKVVLLDADSLGVVASGVMDQGTEQDARARDLLDRLLDERGLTRDAVAGVVATGYGRNIVGFADMTITEITCHARGVSHLVPDVATIIDIGGQDSKFIRLNAAGAVQDFAMNDRCAAGTGCFLEVVAARLDVSLDELGRMAGRSRESIAISSMCVVFAETEIIGLLAAGAQPEDIVAGVQTAIATRVSSMAGRNVCSPVVFTGGVAMIPGMEAALESVLAHPVSTAPEPQMTGALGAAILAGQEVNRDNRGL